MLYKNVTVDSMCKTSLRNPDLREETIAKVCSSIIHENWHFIDYVLLWIIQASESTLLKIWL